MHKGLTTEEAEKLLEEHGPNALPEKRGRGLVRVFFEQFKNPLIYLLVAASVLTFFFGKATDPLVVLGVAIINAVVGTFQEGRAERSLKALRKYAELKVRVVRDGVVREIPSSQLVPGDLVSLVSGDLIPADGELVEGAKVKVNEAVLTGESLSVNKKLGDELFSGTSLQHGRATLIVKKTGLDTELGKIALLTEASPSVKTPIEERIEVFGKELAYIAIGVALFIIGAGWFRSISKGELVMAAVSEVVSIIPEGLPVAITIALAVGVQRMASKMAIVRKLHAVETLGSTSVICSDKTGTLTRNQMIVKEYTPHSEEMIKALVLCNDATLETGDPLEIALLHAAVEAGIDIDEVRKKHARVEELPFSAEHKMMATQHVGGYTLIKGAYEVLSAMVDDNALDQQMETFAAKGYRVLACGIADGVKIDQDRGPEQFQGKARLLGIVALYDPPRIEAQEAIRLCRHAGVRTVMVTGDHLHTAMAIARDLDILQEGDIGITGDELEQLTLEELTKECKKIAVFARLHPEQKLKIVKAFQERDEVVAVTGDGVNDAPALAQADVGVAMGITGTDVAKEASKMIILDDNFATIVKAVAEGRLVYRNLKKVIFYLLATSLSGALALLTGVVLGWPLIMNPLHILWINVVTEGTVTINLIMDPPFGDEMERPPVNRHDRILERKKILPMCLTIFWIGTMLILTFLHQHGKGYELIRVQTEVFTLFAFSAWFKLLSVRAEERSAFQSGSLFRNRYLAIGLGLGIVLHAAVLYVPFMNNLFYTVPLPLSTVGILLLLASTILWFDELRKLMKRF